MNLPFVAQNLEKILDQHDAQLIAMFLATKRRRSETTAKVYEGVIFEFCAFLGNKPLREITYFDLIEYSAYLAKNDPYRKPTVLAVSTQNRKIASIKSLFKYAMKIGYLPMNPAEPLEIQRVNSKKIQRILTIDELDGILNEATKKSSFHTLIVYFFACTGCRVSELSNLMWRDIFIDPQGQTCVSITGKGNKTRILKVNHSLWEVILSYRNDSGLSTQINIQDPSPLLMNPYGDNYHPQTFWRIIKDLAKSAGLSKNVSPHWIRHSFATAVARDKSSNLWMLQNDMGHASIVTTQEYVHIAQGMEDTSIDHVDYLSRLEKRL